MASYKSNIISSNKINEGPQCSLLFRKLPSWRLPTVKMLVPDRQRMMTHSCCLEFSYILPPRWLRGGCRTYLWPSVLLGMHNRLLVFHWALWFISTITRCGQAWPQSSLLLCEKNHDYRKSHWITAFQNVYNTLRSCNTMRQAQEMQHKIQYFGPSPSSRTLTIFSRDTTSSQSTKEESRNTLVLHGAYTWTQSQNLREGRL